MNTNVQLLRSSISNKRPDPSSLLDGQAAVNYHVDEPGLYFKLTNGNLTKIGPVAISSDTNAPNASPIGEAGNSKGETWLDARTAFSSPILKVFDGANWVTANGFLVDNGGNFEVDRNLTATALIGDGLGGDSYIRVPRDTTANRPAGAAGMIRFNTTLNQFEGHDGTSWGVIPRFENNIIVEDLTANGDVILGTDCADDTLTVTAVATFNCNVTIGDAATDTLTVTSVISSNLVPDGNLTRDLGSAAAQWNRAFLGNLLVTGNSAIGNAAADVLTVSATASLLSPTNVQNSMTLWNTQELRFSPTANPSAIAPFVGFQSPATTAITGGSVIWTLPGVIGGANQVLSNDGAGNLSWVANGGIGGNGNFATLNVTGNSTLGNSCVDDTVTVNGRFFVNCNAVIGNDAATDTVQFISRVVSNFEPNANNTYDLGSNALQFANVWATNIRAGDLHLTNERGSWTVIEEETYLSLRNNKTGKIFKIMMEEV